MPTATLPPPPPRHALVQPDVACGFCVAFVWLLCLLCGFCVVCVWGLCHGPGTRSSSVAWTEPLEYLRCPPPPRPLSPLSPAGDGLRARERRAGEANDAAVLGHGWAELFHFWRLLGGDLEALCAGDEFAEDIPPILRLPLVVRVDPSDDEVQAQDRLAVRGR